MGRSLLAREGKTDYSREKEQQRGRGYLRAWCLEADRKLSVAGTQGVTEARLDTSVVTAL